MKYYHGIRNKKNYFEGWFFKHSSKQLNIAFIPSIAYVDGERQCFIQVITQTFSHLFKFPFSSFQADYKELNITVDDNHFSAKGININLQDEKYSIKGNIKYGPFFIPKQDIMGPFDLFPFMECKHNLFSMKHQINGFIIINDKKYSFTNDLGYLEGDYGHSFPENYIWIQSNNFEKDVSFFLSIATIPYLGLKFQGLISSLVIDNKEYRFATYNRSKIKLYTNDHIIIKKGKLTLDLKINQNNAFKLAAPKNGSMTRQIYETLTGEIELTLRDKKQILFQGQGTNSGIEIS